MGELGIERNTSSAAFITTPFRRNKWVTVAAIGSWLVLLTSQSIAITTVPVLLAIALLWLGFTLTLTPTGWRKPAALAYVLLLLFYSLSILGLQQLPQWTDVPPDSNTYDLKGQAIDRHLDGETLPAEEFGLQVGEGETTWSPETPWSYAYVLGSVDFLYQMYVGYFYHLTTPDSQALILSHATMLAALPIFVFLLSIQLVNDKTLAGLASLLVVLDTNFSVNASWLLKDTWVTLLTTIALLTSASLLTDKDSQQHTWRVVILTLALTALSCLRSHVAIAFWIVLAFLITLRIFRGNRRVVALLFTLFVSYYISGLMKLPLIELNSEQTYVNALFSNVSSLIGTIGVIEQSAYSTPNGAIDSAVAKFHSALDKSPLVTASKSIAHTLFAPYPWIALTHGFRGSAMELYWPGTTLWIFGLPFMFSGLAAYIRRGSMEHMLPVFVSLIIVAAYIVTFGEFSTRQRQFLMPLFWIWAAYGITLGLSRIRRLRAPAT